MKFTKKDLETIFLENGIVSENPYKIIERLKSQNQKLFSIYAATKLFLKALNLSIYDQLLEQGFVEKAILEYEELQKVENEL
jgi:hypothetical protein